MRKEVNAFEDKSRCEIRKLISLKFYINEYQNNAIHSLNLLHVLKKK